jgi:hypothetical protein
MRRIIVSGGLVAVAALMLTVRAVPEAPKAAPSPEAVERTRDTVQMLDNLYKMYVVNITGTYVEAAESVAAAKPTKKVMQHMSEKGFHTARLIDLTGKPMSEANVAKSDFEKKAADALKGGKEYFDEVGTGKDGKPVLRAATVVPVVMKQCAACHTHKKQGELLGAIVYEVPIK